MNRKQFLLTLLLAVISAFLGGTFGVWFLMPQSVLVQGEVPKVIEAQEFRAVDSTGEIVAVLNAGGLNIRYLREDEPLATYDHTGMRVRGLRSSDDNVVALQQITGLEIKLDDADFSLSPYGGLSLSQHFLDGEGFRRLNTLNIDISGEGEASFELESGLSRMSFSVEANEEPSLSLLDKKGHTRAVLGRISLDDARTGSTEIRAPSSLVLFDEDGNVVWSAP